MTTYLVATLARYVLVDAEDETDARQRGYDLYADIRARLGREMPINIRTVRPATDDEIDLWRWHHEMVAAEKARAVGKLFGKPLVDPEAQARTDWTPMSVPGRENADGTATSAHWFAYNRATRKTIEFANLDEAKAFCFHPENRR